MLSIFFLYYIGKQFYDLAGLHNKSKWGFGILGVIVYYAGTVTTVIILIIFIPESVETMHDIVLTLISIPISIVFTYVFYKILEHNWSKVQDNYIEGDILDQNLNNPNQGA